MRRAAFRSSAEEGRALLERAPVVHLATTTADGRPILRAVHGVVDGDVLAFHGAPAGEKLAGLGRQAVIAAHEIVAEIPSWFVDPQRACPATTYYVSAQVHGVLEEITAPDVKARVLQALMAKYQPEGRHVPIRSDDPLYAKAVRGLLVAGVRLDDVVCKAKLGQNGRLEERRRVVSELWKRGGPGDARAVDTLVRRFPELTPPRFERGGLRLACMLDASELDEIAPLLDEAYWLAGVPREAVLAAFVASAAVVTARDARTGALVALARATSDGKVAWIYDVVVRDDHRRAGAGTAVMELLLEHPAVRDARHVRLTTRDADAFYRRLGFLELAEAPRHAWRSIEMIRVTPTVAIDQGFASG
ncbi:MAG: GNAT family N-acetyltransferase [Labilithrix sp.]|nr:GNAT family N-acetyltransferase [Labilithrix sp.]